MSTKMQKLTSRIGIIEGKVENVMQGFLHLDQQTQQEIIVQMINT